MILFRAFSAFAVVGTGYLGRCPRLLHCAPSALKLARTSGKQHEECSQRLSVCVGNILSPGEGNDGNRRESRSNDCQHAFARAGTRADAPLRSDGGGRNKTTDRDWRVHHPFEPLMIMGIVASVKIGNVLDDSMSVSCGALVDTRASHMLLPTAWKERLGSLDSTRTIELETATHQTITGEVCGPVRIQIEGFRPIFNEVAFVEMKPADGQYEPLIGYIVLEQSQAAVDILGHRLVPIKHMDLKSLICARVSCLGSYSELSG